MNDFDIETIIENSFKNFHVKGFDYICLKRTQSHTRKVYFFDGDVTKLPEIVNPHDHRYDFTTTVLKGSMSNSLYIRDNAGIHYNEFEWRTPLLGGNGFTWKGETCLREIKRNHYDSDGVKRYGMMAEEFHTIRMHSDNVIIVLDQYSDIVPIHQPTLTFMQDKKAPSLDGLYEKFTPDEVINRLNILRGLL